VRRWTHAVVDAGQVFDVRIVVQIEVDSIPARLEVDLSAEAIDAVCLKHVVLFWNIVSSVNTTETYSVGDWTGVEVGQGGTVVRALPTVPCDHPEPWWKRHGV
jgi:hypothetical protein